LFQVVVVSMTVHTAVDKDNTMKIIIAVEAVNEVHLIQTIGVSEDDDSIVLFAN
jgi:hypothetical protein